MNQSSSVVRLTSGPRHHFFGFHDLAISSRKSGRVLCLAVDQIKRPPVPQDKASVCVLDPDELETLTEITRTSTYNFPQGARQQWLGQSEHFIVNQRGKNGTISSIFDAISGEKLTELKRGAHIVDRQGRIAYSMDYGRLHRLGGYGYVGIPDEYPDDPAPAQIGIFATNLETGSSRLILSIAEVVGKNERARKSRSHHYFTHLSLNPRGDRLAFLHRYRLPDGGEDTCLVTVGVDGQELRILAQGFLSHFDWKNDQQIMIWGRKNSAASELRNSSFLQNPLLRAALKNIKNIVRPLLAKSAVMQMSFLLVSDEAETHIKEMAVGILTADGHPMVDPINRDWLIVDTYPDTNGVRDLMLYRFSDQSKINLGRYPMLADKPSHQTVEAIARHIRENIDVDFPPDLYAFTRSGLHCDLHPRWFADGKRVAFDSIHEGARQLYAINVADKMLSTPISKRV